MRFAVSNKTKAYMQISIRFYHNKYLSQTKESEEEMRLRKFLILLLVFCFIGSMFFLNIGCKEEIAEETTEEEFVEETTEEEAVEETIEEEVAEESSGPVTITTWDLVEGDDARIKIEQAIQAAFDDSHPNIIVNREALPGTIKEDRQTFTNAMMADTAPDAYHRAYFSQIPIWIDEGFCYPLDDYIANWEDKDSVLDAVWEIGAKDGKIYGIPGGGGQNWGMAMYALALFYRSDIFEEYGLDPTSFPKDWDELAEYAMKVTDLEKDRYGFGILGMDWAAWIWEVFVWQAGGEVTTLLPSGEVELTFTGQAGVDATKYWQDLVNKYKDKKMFAGMDVKEHSGLRGNFIVGDDRALILSGPVKQGEVAFWTVEEEIVRKLNQEFNEMWAQADRIESEEEKK